MKYHLWTVGCQMNTADSDKLAAGFDRMGLTATDEMNESGIVVVNTCSVRQHAEDRAYSKLGRIRLLKEENPDLKVAVMGCMVGPRTDDLQRRFPFVDVFARPQQFEPIVALLDESAGEDLGGEFWPSTYAIPEGPTAYVPIVHGCNKFCTYCIVPYRRGRERSRPVDEIVREVAYLNAHGVREVTLLGQTVEAYGHDLDSTPDLGDLMAALSDLGRPGAHPVPHLIPEGHDATNPRTRGRAAEGDGVLLSAGAVGKRRGSGLYAARVHGRRVPGEGRRGAPADARRWDHNGRHRRLPR